jgi:hypothetical protein
MTRAGTIVGFGLAALAAAAATPTPSRAASFTPDPKGIDVVKFFVADDARLGIFATGNSVFHYNKWTGPYLKTTPQQIEQDYSSNEVSADAKYNDVLIVFSGRIDTVRKDLFGSPFVTVDTGKMFHEIQAKMNEDTAAISKLSKGDKINLVCKGASYSIMSPILHHCRLRDDYMAAEEQQAADDVAGWLNGSGAPPFLDTPEMRTIAFYLYFSGTKMPHPEQCTRQQGGNVADCAKQLKASTPSHNEIKAAMDAARDELGLTAEPPALPAQ